MSTTKKVLIVVGIVAIISVGSYFIFRTKKPAVPAGPPTGSSGTPISSAPAGIPALSVSYDTGATDDYSITFDGMVFYYSRGDAPVTNPIDSTWSLYLATAQDNTNDIIVTILQNNNVVFTQNYK